MRAVFAGVRIQDVVYGTVNDGAPQNASFGMVARGNVWLRDSGPGTGREPILLSGGDCFLTSQYSLHGHDYASISGGSFRIVSGQEVLPPVVVIRAGRTGPMAHTLELIMLESESKDEGSQVVLDHLAEIFVAQALRAFLSEGGQAASPWLRAISDPQIGAAIEEMHEQLDRPWTVMELASIAGMSRSAFAFRFKELLGEAPLEHLTRCRMQAAERLLRENGHKLFEIAQAVGYDSDGAFHRAFKRVVGVTPGEYKAAL